ncbi:MAG TPA: MBOAT family O-acyltransferase [Kiritimatiellia bacterium]|nr:MBOAT family O-acyltransferase [Kiritimatiellia bacterium]
MVFSSVTFLFGFLPLVLLAYGLMPKPGKNLLLLMASLLFYAWGELEYVAIMLVSILINYGAGIWIEMVEERRVRLFRLWVGLTGNLVLLMYFKYANFLADNADVVLAAAGMPTIRLGPVHLPLGISFFTFQAMSYVVDVYRGQVKAQRRFVDIALYISLFPQLIAGPIVRYHDIAAQIVKRVVTLDLFASGVRLFIIGLGKKMLIANTLGEQSDLIFGLPGDELSAAIAWQGIIYAVLQLYFDFSGYSDMAIGLGRMFGFQFNINFNYPYISKSLTEFWQRWHISLSTWFRDYLFTPLGGYRCSRKRAYANLMIVFILCGMWHGATWNFFFFGAYQSVFLVIERMVRIKRIALFQTWFGHVYLIFIVLTTMVFFWTDDLVHAGKFYRAMFGFGTAPGGLHVPGAYFNGEILVVLVAALLGSTPWLVKIGEWLEGKEKGRPVVSVARQAGILVALGAILLFCMMKLAAGTHNPFIYFRF